MIITVLMVNYDDEAQKLYIPLLSSEGITARAVPMQDALVLLANAEYSGVVINGDVPGYLPFIKVMRKLTKAPVCVSASRLDPDEAREARKNGANIYRVRYDAAKYRVENFSNLIKIYVEFIAGKYEDMTVIAYGDLQVFPETRKASMSGVEVYLSPTEFSVLYFLIANKGIVLSYEQIFRRVWGDEYMESPRRLIWCHVSRLRHKLSADLSQPDFISTKRGYGYSFDPIQKTV